MIIIIIIRNETKQNEKWKFLLLSLSRSMRNNNNEMKMFRHNEQLSNRLVVVSLGCERGLKFKNTFKQRVYINYSVEMNVEKGLTMSQSAWLRLYLC